MGKKEILLQLAEQIRKLSASLNVNTAVGPFLFSNEDFTRKKVIGRIRTALAKVANSSENQINIAILVGESHLLSILPELNGIDLIIIFDITSSVHMHVKDLVACLQNADNKEDFVACYSKLSYANTEALLNQKDKLGDAFFLASDARYQACKATSEKIVIANYCADMLNTDHVDRLCQLLYAKGQNNKVKFINLSNIRDCVQPPVTQKDESPLLQRNLKQLLKHTVSNYQVLYSRISAVDLRASYRGNSFFSIHLTEGCEFDKMKTYEGKVLREDGFYFFSANPIKLMPWHTYKAEKKLKALTDATPTAISSLIPK